MSTIPGGYFNVIRAPYAFAAGVGAVAAHQGSLVMSDGQLAYFFSTRSNEFSIRAQNGVNILSDVGIHLSAGNEPIIVRDFDVFATNAPPQKAGIGRWGMFMEPGALVMGIPGDDLPFRTFAVAKYNTNGTFIPLLQVDQAGTVTANNFVGTVSAAELSGPVPSVNVSGTYANAVTFNNPGNSFTGNGGGLTNVNAATLGGLNSSAFAQLNSSPTFTGTVTAPSIIASNAQFSGLIRAGAENIGQTPFPAGLVTRRVNSTSRSDVIAITRVSGTSSNITLLRDGSDSGFQITFPAVTSRSIMIACMGIDATGAARNFYTNVTSLASGGTVQVYSFAQNVVHFECTFGDTFDSGQHLTQVTLSRSGADFFWSGTLTSTLNQ